MIQRKIEEVLRQEYKARAGRDRMIAVHGNRLVAWAVFQNLLAGGEIDEMVGTIVEELTIKALDAVTKIANAEYPDSYLATLFKNLTKCRDIAQKLPSLALA
jgi:hypothetical protein